MKDDPDLFDFNVQERVNAFVAAALDQVDLESVLFLLVYVFCDMFFCVCRPTLLERITSCSPWEQILGTSMHTPGFDKWTSFFIMLTS